MAASSSTQISARPILNPEYDFSTGVAAGPSIYQTSIVNTTAGSTTTLSAGGETTFVFELPTHTVFNLHNTRLKGVYTCPTANAGLAQFINWMPPFSRVEVQTGSGTRLFFLPQAQAYFRLCRSRGIPMKDWMTRELPEMHGPCNVPSDDTQALIPATSAIPDVKSTLKPSDVSVPAVQLEDPSCPLLLRSIPAGASRLAINFNIRLGDLLPDSFLGLSHDLMFPEKVTIQLTVANQNSFIWCATSQADSQAGAVVNTATDATLTSFHLDLQLQVSPVRVEYARNIFKDGFQMAIPYLFNNGPSDITAGTTTLGFSLPITGGGVTEIRSIIWGLSGSGQPWRRADFSNIDSGSYQRLLSFRTYADALNLQNADVNCTSSLSSGTGPYTDYEMNKDGTSAMFRSRLSYMQCWSHKDDFLSMRKVGDDYSSVAKPAIFGGLPLKGPGVSGQVMYRINGVLQPGTLAEALILNWFAICTATIRWAGSRVETIS